MPIGSGKVGLFGGIAVEAGCQTFNAPGTFTVVQGTRAIRATPEETGVAVTVAPVAPCRGR